MAPMKPSTQTKPGTGRRALGVRLFLLWICGLVSVLAPFSAVAAGQAWERNDVLDAIHQVENPYNVTRIGRRGELGPFQFRPAVWYSYTKKPFALAIERAEAQIVAEAHYEWIKRGLERNKLEVTPYHIGLVWNAGLHATINGRASSTSRYYAERVANLVDSKIAAALAASPDTPAVEPAAAAEPARLTESM